jgi:hypothetical protein
MEKTHIFLFGKETAYKMLALETGLQEIETRHQLYFASIPSKFTIGGEESSVTLAEFVQPRWQGSIPSLFIAPDLPADIAAECIDCVQRVAMIKRPKQPIFFPSILTLWYQVFYTLLFSYQRSNEKPLRKAGKVFILLKVARRLHKSKNSALVARPTEPAARAAMVGEPS